jgi:DNA invertase Pin-like site-specific DNA recombinase
VTKLIPYLRKSSKEDPAISKERQLRAIKAWAKQNDVRLGPAVWEAGISGSKRWQERGLGQALAACERGEAAGIIVEEQSRLSRQNGLATAEMWDAFQQAGIRLVCIADGLDTASGDQELNFGIRALLAREQWKQYARRMEDSKRNAVARGIHISPKAPFGYRRKNKRLVPDPETGPVVSELFARRSSGEPYSSLIRWLDKVAPRDGGWRKQTLRRIFMNRVYLGEARQGKHTRPEAHSALVDEELFGLVAARVRQAEPSVRLNGKTAALLAGFVRCSECGYALSRSWSGGRWVYRHRVGSPCPAPSSIVLEQLDEYVTEQAFTYADGHAHFALSASNAVREALNMRLVAARAKRAPFEDPEYVQLLGLDAAKRALAKADGEITALEAELVKLPDEAHVLDFEEARKSWNDTSVEGRAEVLATVIQDVLISRAPRGTRLIDRVRIVWFDEVSPIVRPSRGRAGNNGVVDTGVLSA